MSEFCTICGSRKRKWEGAKSIPRCDITYPDHKVIERRIHDKVYAGEIQALKIYCPNCHAQGYDVDKFCGSCGEEFTFETE